MAYVVDPLLHHKNPMCVDAYRKFFPLVAKEFDNQRFSILFNAYVEPRDGESWRKDFTHDDVKLYADSGGLQMITLGKEVTPEIKNKIYNVQGRTSDYAMIFDEIPAIKLDDRTLKNSSSRLFDADKFEECAKQTAANVREQLDVFDQMGTDTRPLLILQGNDTVWYQEWLDICLDELGPSYYERLSGLAFGTPVYGNGIIEDIERLFWIKDIQAPNHLKNHIHLLGVGSINRFIIASIMRHSGALPEKVHLSYDSSKLTGGTRWGEYHIHHKVKRFWRHDPTGLDNFIEESRKLCNKAGIEFCESHLRSVILHSQEIRDQNDEKSFEYEKLNLAYVQAFLTSAYGFMQSLEAFRDRSNIEKYCKHKELLPLLDISDNDTFYSWKDEMSKILKTDKVLSKSAYTPPSSLEGFF
jgi:hypothetical protein